MDRQVLLADEHKEFTDIVADYLHSNGFRTKAIHDGEQTIKLALNEKFDAIVMSLSLPKLHGFEVIKTIRTHQNTPIIVLTKHAHEAHQIIGFDFGIDDYITTPCSPRVLVARVKSHIEKLQLKQEKKSPIIERHNILVDSNKRIAHFNGQLLELTNAEYNILEMLIRAPGQAFSKEELTEYALHRKFTAFDRSIDVHISNLRNKINDGINGQIIIKTLRGFGYSME